MLEPEVIYEDKNFLAVNKPAGLLVHGARNISQVASESTLVDWLVQKYPEIKTVGDDPETRPGIIHRLDKATSGVLLIARTQDYFKYLKSLFQKHEIKKIYLAVAAGIVEPREGIIDRPIGIRNGTLKRSVHSAKMAKEAVTGYKVVKYISDTGQAGSEKKLSFLEIYPKTGRTHQIRVHLGSIGHPIMGDLLYGGKVGHRPLKRLMLHALSIEFTDNNGRRMKIEAEPPDDFMSIINASDN
ncbi:MAG: RluA family pseudouridine synthase [Patescibacteria group bacterium]|nr:RluA family pseudouridine synthase [Patescibacteria group bacterium]MDE2015364.1 RluA family pseudouridine synthase [Patescibacteria group bacterium]MDE2227021.1 RluA family pseudouridine synthase [Patescibacteria group bacterium]